MRHVGLRTISLAAVLLMTSSLALADAKEYAMRHLASKSGCFICHGIELDSKGPDGLKPVGPPWKAIAERYRGDKTAAKRLTTEVLAGTSPYARHWKDETSGVAMPPNGVAIKEDDAKTLVEWILSLK